MTTTSIKLAAPTWQWAHSMDFGALEPYTMHRAWSLEVHERVNRRLPGSAAWDRWTGEIIYEIGDPAVPDDMIEIAQRLLDEEMDAVLRADQE